MGNTIKVLAQALKKTREVSRPVIEECCETLNESSECEFPRAKSELIHQEYIVPLLPDVQIQYYKSAFPTIIIFAGLLRGEKLVNSFKDWQCQLQIWGLGQQKTFSTLIEAVGIKFSFKDKQVYSLF